MPIQFVSQLAQMRDTWMVIAEARKSETETPKSLELLEQGVTSIDQVLNNICSELDIRITPVEAPMPENLEIASQMTKETLTCSELSSDRELSDCAKNPLIEHRDALTREKQQLVLFGENLLRTADEPMTAAALHAALLDKIFVPSNQFPPYLQMVLIQEVCDEIFGFGPLSPFIRIFPEMEMLEDGSFKALKQVVGVKDIVPVDKPLHVEFDDELHREEVLALFKLNRRSNTDDFVEYTQPETWKVRIPKGIAEVIESKQTRMEKLGLLKILKDGPSQTILQKIGDWFSSQFGRSRTEIK